MPRGGARPGAGRSTDPRKKRILAKIKDGAERCVPKLIELAEQGSPWALRYLMDRAWGCPRTSMDVGVAGLQVVDDLNLQSGDNQGEIEQQASSEDEVTGTE